MKCPIYKCGKPLEKKTVEITGKKGLGFEGIKLEAGKVYEVDMFCCVDHGYPGYGGIPREKK